MTTELKQETYTYLDPKEIDNSQYQPRSRIDKEKINELKESIIATGSNIEAVTIMRKKDQLITIAGHRRVEASLLANLPVKAQIISSNITEDVIWGMAISTNIKEDMLTSDLILAIKKLKDLNISVREISKTLGLSHGKTQRYYTCTNLVQPILEKIDTSDLPISKAELVAQIDSKYQYWFVDEIINNKWNTNITTEHIELFNSLNKSQKNYLKKNKLTWNEVKNIPDIKEQLEAFGTELPKNEKIVDEIIEPTQEDPVKSLSKSELKKFYDFTIALQREFTEGRMTFKEARKVMDHCRCFSCKKQLYITLIEIDEEKRYCNDHIPKKTDLLIDDLVCNRSSGRTGKITKIAEDGFITYKNSTGSASTYFQALIKINAYDIEKCNYCSNDMYKHFEFYKCDKCDKIHCMENCKEVHECEIKPDIIEIKDTTKEIEKDFQGTHIIKIKCENCPVENHLCENSEPHDDYWCHTHRCETEEEERINMITPNQIDDLHFLDLSVIETDRINYSNFFNVTNSLQTTISEVIKLISRSGQKLLNHVAGDNYEKDHTIKYRKDKKGLLSHYYNEAIHSILECNVLELNSDISNIIPKGYDLRDCSPYLEAQWLKLVIFVLPKNKKTVTFIPHLVTGRKSVGGTYLDIFKEAN